MGSRPAFSKFPEASSFSDFLGAFAKWRKSTLSFVMFVRPSTWNNSTTTGQILIKFDI
jgi:hypothetical protein